MTIGNVIKKYRKNKDMTQEEMASRLGVTAPAVNKWEKGNTLPDVTLLAPIARLLGITTDELLSFRDELSINIYQRSKRTWRAKTSMMYFFRKGKNREIP